MLILDLIILIILALFTFIGYKKGLINTAFSILSFFIAIILSFILFKPISNIVISKTNIDESIQKTVYEKISVKDNDELRNNFDSLIENKKDEITDTIRTEISQKVSNLIINIIIWILILVITKIILFFFKSILNAIANLPLLKQINKTGGLIFGFLKGLFIIYILFAILLLLSNIIAFDNFNSLLNTSILAKFLYNNNILIFLLK